jgi:uncharacterized protein YprB with RNaseH-like and TPR domain
MDSYKFQSLDITRFIERYSGESLEDLFQNQNVVQNDMGEFLELTWEIEKAECPSDINLQVTRKNLMYNLKTVYYIGENIENYLLNRGIRNLIDLKSHLRYRKYANEILDLIKNKDCFNLCKNKYINDLDVIFCFELEDLLFLDIETLGIYDSPMIVVGLGYFKEKKFNIDILFARDLEEEISICEHLKNAILPNFKCLVSYNGKSFDIPYIANRFLYYFDENPMISEDDIPYKQVNTKYHHIDLYHCCRRKYKGMYHEYTLTNMEEQLLQMKRENELPSNLVGACYKMYLKNPQKYIGLIKEIIEHNYYDIYALPLILQKILED